MVDYDEKVIKEYAKNLYAQTKSIVTCHFFIGLLFGLIVAGFLSVVYMDGRSVLLLIIGVLVGGFMGIFSGRNRVSEMQLQAQLALCLARIQENTKRSG